MVVFALRKKIVDWLARWQPSEWAVLGGTALLVGLTSGIGVWLFKRLIDLAHTVMFNGLGAAFRAWGAWSIALLPMLGGIVVGLVMHFLIGEERHHGVAGIMEAVALAGGRLRYRRVPLKAVAAALAIGSGASVGPEDPSVQIGSALGSFFGQTLRLSDERVRTLVAAGAAGGIAAAFNAPIAGVFFAIEIILGELGGGGALGGVVVAAVISAVFTQAVSGTQPAFRVPAYPFRSALELPLYLGLGLLAGPVAALYIRALYTAQDVFQAWRIPRWLKTATAGLVVGLAGIFLPQIFGVGYETIERILNGESLALTLLVALLAAKLVMTAVSIGGGFPGGVFAPSLFLGATLGAAYGAVVDRLFPGLNAAPPAFAMVGMAAVLAGAVHAPLTAIILLFEMTNDYRIILPLMFAVTISLFLAQAIQRDSVYTLSLVRKGIRLQHGRDVDVLEAITVGEIMQTQVVTLRESDSLATAADVFMRTRHHGLPVVNDAGELVGIFTVQDLDRAQENEVGAGTGSALGAEKKTLTVGDACTRELLVAYPDETMGAALRRMSIRDVGRLPVVARDNPRKLLGVLRRTDLVRAYNIALTRRAALRHRAHQVRLSTYESISVEEVTIQPGAPCVGHRIREVAWPSDCIITTIRRGRQVIIPNGNTVLQAGDVLVAVAEGRARADLKRLCLAEAPDTL